MEINFTRKDFSYLLKYEKLAWQGLIKRTLAALSSFFIVGGLCLLDATDRYSKTGTFTGITCSIAFGIFVSAILILLYQFYQRYKAFRKTRHVIKTYQNESETVTICMDAWSIKTSSFEVSTEYKWSYFVNYKTYPNAVVIIPKHHSFHYLLFERSEMSAEMYEQLLNILKTKFGNRGNRM